MNSKRKSPLLFLLIFIIDLLTLSMVATFSLYFLNDGSIYSHYWLNDPIINIAIYLALSIAVCYASSYLTYNIGKYYE